MKNVDLKKLISISLLSLVIVSCSKNGDSDRPVIYDDPDDDIIIDEEIDNLSKEEAQVLAEETSKESRATYLEAYTKADTATCDAIESDDLRFSCIQSALTQKAILENDVKICEQLESEKGQKTCVESFERAQVPADEEEAAQ